MDSKVSFTIRRPTPVSRATSSGPDSDAGSSFKVPKLPRRLVNGSVANGSPLARSATSSPHPPRQNEVVDSSDEDAVEEDELISGFGSLGAQRVNGDRKKNSGPLVIPALQNKDWREVARKRRSAGQFVPSTMSGKDGSVGGLGTRDTINSGPVLSGLITKQVKETIVLEKEEIIDTEMVPMEETETEDQRALRAVLESTGETAYDTSVIDIIPTPVSESDALKQDMDELPEPATLEDYSRVPVSQFGAALLRGMGWREGTAASRKPGKGLVAPYLPVARPALLGIGAKEQEIYDDGSDQKKKKKRPETRYVPVIKQERSGTSTPVREARPRSRSPRRSGAPSRRSSRSRERYNRDDRSSDNRNRQDQDEYRDRDRRRNDDQGADRERRRDDNRNRDRDRKYESQSGRGDDGRPRHRVEERDRSERRNDRSRERGKD